AKVMIELGTRWGKSRREPISHHRLCGLRLRGRAFPLMIREVGVRGVVDILRGMEQLPVNPRPFLKFGLKAKSAICAFLAVLALSLQSGHATTITVDSLEFSWTPAPVTIQVGDTVHWINLLTHNVIETSKANYDADQPTALPGGFRSGQAS